MQREHGEAVIEVFAEPPRLHRFREIVVRRGDDRDVDGLASRAAETADRALVDDLEELGLERVGQERDLVEEDRAAARGLKEAGLRLARVGEGAALEAEQLRFEQSLRDRRAVHVDERALARPGAVDHARHQRLSGSGLALQQDRGEPARRRRPLEDLTDTLPHGDHRGALAEQIRGRVHPGIMRPVIRLWLFSATSAIRPLTTALYLSIIADISSGVRLAP